MLMIISLHYSGKEYILNNVVFGTTTCYVSWHIESAWIKSINITVYD